jgi:hypothetical protein
MSGAVVYAGVIILANLKILSAFHNYMIIGELIIFIMIFDYFLIFYLENLAPLIH